MKGYWLNLTCTFSCPVLLFVSSSGLHAAIPPNIVPLSCTTANDCVWLGGTSGCSAEKCDVQNDRCSCTGTTAATCPGSCA